jgi:hypothetical protein
VTCTAASTLLDQLRARKDKQIVADTVTHDQQTSSASHADLARVDGGGSR